MDKIEQNVWSLTLSEQSYIDVNSLFFSSPSVVLACVYVHTHALLIYKEYMMVYE